MKKQFLIIFASIMIFGCEQQKVDTPQSESIKEAEINLDEIDVPEIPATKVEEFNTEETAIPSTELPVIFSKTRIGNIVHVEYPMASCDIGNSDRDVRISGKQYVIPTGYSVLSVKEKVSRQHHSSGWVAVVAQPDFILLSEEGNASVGELILDYAEQSEDKDQRLSLSLAAMALNNTEVVKSSSHAIIEYGYTCDSNTGRNGASRFSKIHVALLRQPSRLDYQKVLSSLSQAVENGQFNDMSRIINAYVSNIKGARNNDGDAEVKESKKK